MAGLDGSSQPKQFLEKCGCDKPRWIVAGTNGSRHTTRGPSLAEGSRVGANIATLGQITIF